MVLTDFLGRTFSREIASIQSDSHPSPLKNDDVAAVAAVAKQPLVWDFKTENLHFLYRPFSWSTFYLQFKLRARLISTTEKRILWQGVCTSNGALEKSEKELFDGDGLYPMLQAATDACVKELAGQFQETDANS